MKKLQAKDILFKDIDVETELVKQENMILEVNDRNTAVELKMKNNIIDTNRLKFYVKGEIAYIVGRVYSIGKLQDGKHYIEIDDQWRIRPEIPVMWFIEDGSKWVQFSVEIDGKIILQVYGGWDKEIVFPINLVYPVSNKVRKDTK